MLINERVNNYEKVMPGWTIGKLLGHGSGGRTAVYKISRSNIRFVENDVLKVVNIIEEDMGLNEMSLEYKEDYLTRETDSYKKAEEEVNLMYMLQNCNNIVTYQDFTFHEIREEHYTAVDLLIRMHEYMDLSSILKKRSLSIQEIVKVGIDICTALEGCRRNGIIHRDIKPENIFFDNSQYLLGDFGISRILENGFLAQTSKGTPPYAAPEQFDGGRYGGGYDHRVDIYSLGLTLYVLANKGKLPFMDKSGSINVAQALRLAGNQIPPIAGIDDELNRIILKACEYSPEDRYLYAEDMRENLLNYERNQKRNKILLNSSGGIQNFETERAIKNDKPESYATEAALGTRVAGVESYATEAALGTRVAGVESYATEAALGTRVAGVESYATEAALGTRVAGVESYATEAALGTRVAGVESYATEPALGKGKIFDGFNNYRYEPVSNMGYNSQKTENSSGIVDKIDIPVNTLSAVVTNSSDNEVQNNKSGIVQKTVEDTDYKKKALDFFMRNDNEKAVEMFKKMNSDESWIVMYQAVNERFSNETDIAKEPDNAIFWLKKCIELCKDSWTISLIEFKMGDIYSKGIGVKKNHKLAEEYYSQSASKGNPYAKKKFVAGKYVKN